jgi:hypothetical protein
MKEGMSGRVLTIFLIISAILLISLTAISIFFWKLEREKGGATLSVLTKAQGEIVKLEGQLTATEKQNFLLEEKNKEVDEKINSLLDELDLQEGLREEIKSENQSLKEQLASETKSKQQIQNQWEEKLKDYEGKIALLEGQLKVELGLKEDLAQKSKTFEDRAKQLEQQLAEIGALSAQRQGMDLDKIVVEPPTLLQESDLGVTENEVATLPGIGKEIAILPAGIPQGRILSVDTDTEFVIVNLGEKDGVQLGEILSVYRGKDYLGDIKITRVQSEMSAADLVPPFSSKKVRKNDQVVSSKQ